MGGLSCFSSTVTEHYANELKSLEIGTLKDHWDTIKKYKCKTMFEQNATLIDNIYQMNYDQFIGMFPEFKIYQQIHKRRIFQIFDRQNKGLLNWSSFYIGITLCYFATSKIMSIIMFMIFDDCCIKSLTHQQFSLMIELNQYFIHTHVIDHETSKLYQIEQVIEQLNPNKINFTLQSWLNYGKKYIDFEKFRIVFNIFPEQVYEKQLIHNFDYWNKLYNEQQEMYSGYLLNFKWFENWRLYVEHQYGVFLNRASRGFKKTMKQNQKKIQSTNKLAQQSVIKAIPVHNDDYKSNKTMKNINTPENKIKNINYVHSNIGQKPKMINNMIFEGDYSNILKHQLIQNRDYILVSQKVWAKIKQIYPYNHQFLRTGVKSIQMYPKIVRIYTKMDQKGKLNISFPLICQVSKYTTIQNLLVRSLQCQVQTLSNKAIFIKMLGMDKWQQFENLSYTFYQLSNQPIIFISVIDQQQSDKFKKYQCKCAQVIEQINIGDCVLWKSNHLQKQQQKIAYFMGFNAQDKYILTFLNESCKNDICLLANEFKNQCQLHLSEIKQILTENSNIYGLSNHEGNGYINSIIIHLIHNKQLSQILSLLSTQKQQRLIDHLANINTIMKSKQQIDIDMVNYIIEKYFKNFRNFEISKCTQFINKFIKFIYSELNNQNLDINCLKNFQLSFQRNIYCQNCDTILEEISNTFLYTVQIPQDLDICYEIRYVPKIIDSSYESIIIYKFKLKPNATFKQYKQEFEKLISFDNKNYLLVEVQDNDIICNYGSVDINATLEQLRLYDNDIIYAYELYTNFTTFIQNHYKSTELNLNEVEVGDIVDCCYQDKGWVSGRITQKNYRYYLKQTFLKVLHKFNSTQAWQVSYLLDEINIYRFPLKSSLYAEQYHLKVQQRIYQQSSNDMKLFDIPIIIVLANWMRWKEFSYLIYLQMQRFIKQQYTFQALYAQKLKKSKPNIPVNSKKIKTNKSIGNNKRKKQIQMSLHFKNYLESSEFPYKLRICDLEGRCTVCFKFIKSIILKSQQTSFCNGCSLSVNDPIVWQIRIADVMICVDWYHIYQHEKVIPVEDISYTQINNYILTDKIQLKHCLERTQLEPIYQQLNVKCCHRNRNVSIKKKLLNSSKNIIIHLQRIVQQSNGFIKTIHKPIKFEFQNFKIGKNKYNLIGLTTINNSYVRQILYTTYLLQNNQWYQYDGAKARKISQDYLSKLNPLTLFYQQIE